jgi:ribosome assembly protein 1
MIYELQLTPLEAYEHMCRIVEQANVIISSMIRQDILKEEETGNSENAENTEYMHQETTASRERQWMFSPTHGNVLFASAYDGWAFGIGYFAAYYSKKFDMPQGMWRQGLWGHAYTFSQTPTKQMRLRQQQPPSSSSTTTTKKQHHPLFVTYVLEPLWTVYQTMERPEPELHSLRQLTKVIIIMRHLHIYVMSYIVYV